MRASIIKAKILLLTISIVSLSCSKDSSDELLLNNESDEIEITKSGNDELAEKSSSGFGNQTYTLNSGANPEGSDGKCRPWGGDTGSVFKTYAKNLNRSSYNLRFEFKFSKFFDFDKGGKIGYGLGIGDYITGCRGAESQDNKGGSMRIMWRGINDPRTGDCEIDNEKTTKANIIPYLYHRRMPRVCGDDFNKTFSIVRNQWYTVVMKYKANSRGNDDGVARIEIGKHGERRTVLLNRKNMVWSFSNSKNKVTRVLFHLFRGGGGADWASHTSNPVSFRQVTLDF